MQKWKDKLIWRLFWRNESAATAIEFAMVAPLFFLALFVIFETGLMMFTEYVLQTAVQDASRLVRTGQAQEQSMDAATFKAEICDLAGLIIDCTGSVQVYLKAEASFNVLSSTTPAQTSVGLNASGAPIPVPFEKGCPSEAVALIAVYDWDFVVPYFMSFMGNMNGNNTRRLAGYAMFKNEPFPMPPGGC